MSAKPNFDPKLWGPGAVWWFDDIPLYRQMRQI